VVQDFVQLDGDEVIDLSDAGRNHLIGVARQVIDPSSTCSTNSLIRLLPRSRVRIG